MKMFKYLIVYGKISIIHERKHLKMVEELFIVEIKSIVFLIEEDKSKGPLAIY